MADRLSLTQKWLRQNIQPYARRDIVYNHVDAVLAAYPTLRPKTDVYSTLRICLLSRVISPACCP
jgi:ESCRT-I complex subunit TSG101